MIGGGFGARGEIEHTNQNDTTRRIISIRTARSMAVALNLITVAVYLVIFLYWWFVLIQLYEPAPRVSGFAKWWGCVSFVTSTWGRAMGATWPLWLVPLALQWIKPQWTLYRHNLRPKLLNDNYPAPFAQMDPNKSGAVTWENWDARAGVGIATPDTVIPEIELSATLQDGQSSTRTRVRMPVPQVRHWRSFCSAYTRGDCKFSGNAAEGFLGDRVLFDRVVGAWASHDPQRALIDPASLGPRKTPEPTDKGKEMIALFATTPLDELSALLEPYETDRHQIDREG